MSNHDLYTCVVSYHTNPYTCGVARFNKSLADSLGVPLVGVAQYLLGAHGTALLSLKFEEVDEHSAKELLASIIKTETQFGILLHAVTDIAIEQEYIALAENVYVASRWDAEMMHPKRSDVITLFAPGAPITATGKIFDLNLLTFGMAHKIRTEPYRKLGKLLHSDDRTVQLEISTALHEGTSFNEDFFSVGAEIAEVFDGNVSFLGFLADDEVSRRMSEADALVAFFPSGVRENNTTVLSAMAHGCAVITNLDGYSPPWMKHGESVFDVNQLAEFPSSAELSAVRIGAKKAVSPYNFEQLSNLLSKREK
jgi:hypothetical protein